MSGKGSALQRPVSGAQLPKKRSSFRRSFKQPKDRQVVTEQPKDRQVVTEQPEDRQVVTEEIQCLLSPKPRETSVVDEFMSVPEISGVPVLKRNDFLTVETIEKYLRMDAPLKHKAIHRTLRAVVDETLTNLQVVKVIRACFQENVPLWQGLAVYIMKTLDPSKPSKRSPKSSGRPSLELERPSSTTVPSSGEESKEQLEQNDQSMNSSYISVPEDGLNRNLSRFVEELESHSESVDSTDGKKEHYSEKKNSEALTLKAQEVAVMKKQLLSKFKEAAHRIMQGVAVIRSLVAGAKDFRESFVSSILSAEWDSESGESTVDFIIKSLLAHDKRFNLDSKFKKSHRESSRYTFSSERMLTDYNTSESESGGSEDSEGRLMRDVSLLAREGHMLFDEEGREIINLLRIFSASDYDTDEDRSESQFKTTSEDLTSPREDTKLDIQFAENEVSGASFKEFDTSATEKESQEKISLEATEEYDTSVIEKVSVGSIGFDTSVREKVSGGSIEFDTSVKESRERVTVETLEAKGTRGLENEAQESTDGSKGKDSEGDYSLTEKADGSKGKDSEGDYSFTEKTDGSKGKDSEGDYSLTEKTDGSKGKDSERDYSLTEKIYKDDWTEYVTVNVPASRRQFYDDLGRRVVHLPGKCFDWEKIVDESGVEVTNVYKGHMPAKLYDEMGNEVINYDRKSFFDKKIFTKDGKEIRDKKFTERISMFKSESKEVVHGPIIAKKESMSKRESKKDVHDRMADIELLAQKINDFEKVDVSPPSEEYLASLPRKRMKSVLTDKTKLHLDSVLGTTASELEASEKSFRAESYVQCVSPDDKMEVKLYLEKHGIHQLFEMFVNSLVLERPNQPIDFLINLVHEVGICQKKESSILGLHLKVDEMRKSRANKSGLR